LKSEQREVVVVGGGPAGSACAAFLARAGRDVLLLDAARFPRDKVCGESVSPGAWQVLAELGAADAVRALAPRPIRGMRLRSPDGTSFAGRYPTTEVAGFGMRRLTLDATLLEVARRAGAEVREGVTVVAALAAGGAPGAERAPSWPAAAAVGGVLAETAQGPLAVRARLVVAADGRHSRVARSLGLLAERPRHRRFAVRGHFEGVEGLADTGEMHVSHAGYCGVAPLSGGLANVAIVLAPEALALAGGDLTGFFLRTLHALPELGERLARARLLAAPRAIGPLAVEARRPWAPGALLVGDAAGFYDPFTGEGVTLALRSARDAAEVALAALATPSGPRDLRAYEARRHAQTRDKFRVNQLLQRLIAHPALANLAARRLAARPRLADRLVGIAGDLVPAREALGPRFLWELLTA